MKKCKKCDKKKPLSLFYKHKEMSDGHLNICIECTKKRVILHRNKNINSIRAYDRSRGNRQSKEYIKQWRKDNPKKYKAHNAINNALRDGKIMKKLCEECGDKKTVAHHDDYNKPLQVRWLCQGHHMQWHSENGEGVL